jgi:hypothetical protein
MLQDDTVPELKRAAVIEGCAGAALPSISAAYSVRPLCSLLQAAVRLERRR